MKIMSYEMPRYFQILTILFLSFMSGTPFSHTEPIQKDGLFPIGYIPDGLENPSIVTRKTTGEIEKDIENFYQKSIKEKGISFENKNLERLHRLVICYDRISQLRFRRNVMNYSCHKDIPNLIDYFIKTKWYNEFLIKIMSNDAYDYSEDTAIRIIIASHTAAHFFQLPYSALMCLLFQESKFDFKVHSFTGALGLGQLTNIAINHVTFMRKDKDFGTRLRAASVHLQSIYSDPVFDEVLRSMGFYPMFPDLGDFPTEVKKFSPYTHSVIREVCDELIQNGHEYAKDRTNIALLIKKELRGQALSEQYAAVHPALIKVTERHFGKKYGTVLNIETNILLSAMLLKHYWNYPWANQTANKLLSPCVKAVLAIAAYNQGPSVVLKFMQNIEFDNLDKTQPKNVVNLFNENNLRYINIRKDELIRHVNEVYRCTTNDNLE